MSGVIQAKGHKHIEGSWYTCSIILQRDGNDLYWSVINYLELFLSKLLLSSCRLHTEQSNLHLSLPQFTDVKTDIQSDTVSHPNSYSQFVAVLGLELISAGEAILWKEHVL